jgi:D-hydroxyproline dehydrogenase subunit gamma
LSELATVIVRINGKEVRVPRGTTVAAAVFAAGETCRTSVSNHPRAPLCGMGICFECRMIVAGRTHTRTCQILCEPDMEISTDFER